MATLTSFESVIVVSGFTFRTFVSIGSRSEGCCIEGQLLVNGKVMQATMVPSCCIPSVKNPSADLELVMDLNLCISCQGQQSSL